MINEESRKRIMALSQDEFRALFWQVCGYMCKYDNDKTNEAIVDCLPYIENGQVIS